MSCRVILNSKLNTFEVIMHNKIIDINEQISRDLVYQNEAYEISLYLEEEKEIEKIELVINNESINERFRREFISVKDGEYKFAHEYIFSTLFGFANLSIEVSYIDKTKEIYYSDYISIAVDKANEEELLSIEKMIKYIYDKGENLLYSSNINRVSKVLGGIKCSENRSADTEIRILNEIIVSYNINLRYFMSDLKYNVVRSSQIDDFKKLRKIDSDTIKYISLHTDELIPVNYETGICYESQNYQPMKTVISQNSKCFDIYENRVVLGFLKYLIIEVESKIKNINEILEKNQINISLKTVLEKNYILSSDIVYRYSRAVTVQYLEKMKVIAEKLKNLYFSYRSFMKCKEIIINRPAIPSDIFVTIKHYRNIFQEINKWFKYGNYDISKNAVILSFLTADEIYEYYSLLNMIQLFKDMNFIEDESKRDKYNYETLTNWYKNTKIYNTFYFFNDKKRINMYYQPVIYSYDNNTRNNITLFRTDSKKKYFTPDFLIKVYTNSSVKYIILDSKWSKYSTIKKYEFKDLMIKYIMSVKDQVSLNTPIYLWLLQGKDDGNNINTFYYNKSNLGKQLECNLKMMDGIVRLTPNSGTKYLETVLKEIL